MLELAETIRRLARSRSRIVHNPLPVDDPRQRRPDNRLAQSELGWRPKVPLEVGLRRTLSYFRATR